MATQVRLHFFDSLAARWAHKAELGLIDCVWKWWVSLWCVHLPWSFVLSFPISQNVVWLGHWASFGPTERTTSCGKAEKQSGKIQSSWMILWDITFHRPWTTHLPVSCYDKNRLSFYLDHCMLMSLCYNSSFYILTNVIIYQPWELGQVI